MLLRSSLAVALGVGVAVACGGSSTTTSSSGGNGGSDPSTGGASGSSGSSATGGKGGAGGTGGNASGGKGATGGKGGASGSSSGSAGTGGSDAGAGDQGGSPGGGTAGGGTGGLSMDEAPVAVALAACAKIYECCSEAELMTIPIIGGSESACQFAVLYYITLQLSDAGPAFDAGRLDYDGMALQGFVDDISGRQCDMLPSLESLDLSGILVPKVEEGGDCGISYECIDGYCDGGTDAANAVGKCAPKKANDEACASFTECESAYCAGMICADAGDAAALCTGT